MKKLLLLFSCSLTLFYSSEAQTHQVLYGMTSGGGALNAGVIFQYDLNTSTYTKKYDFLNGTTGGGVPMGSLLKASNGLLYGMTSQGGAFGYGTIFSFDPVSSVYSELFEFDSGSLGSIPYGSLIQAPNGRLYGMTSGEGGNFYGNIFEFDISSGDLNGMLALSSSNTGSAPFGSFIQATDGNLYGMTSTGGLDYGVIFQFTYSPINYLNIFEFDFSTTGSGPKGNLLQTTDGKFYGMTNGGGANALGVLFQFDLGTSTYTKILDFDNTTNGGNPFGELIQSSNGILYGMTSTGGTNSVGVLFQYSPTTSTYTKKFDFDGTAKGSTPYGSLKQASDGNLYGMTSMGGSNDMGVLFQYNPTTSTYTKKIDFDGVSSGSGPVSNLIEATINATGIAQYDDESLFKVFPNPSTGKFTIDLTNSQLNMGNIKIQICNIIGEKIYQSQINNSQAKIDLSKQPAGIYFLNITTEQGTISKKLIINK